MRSWIPQDSYLYREENSVTPRLWVTSDTKWKRKCRVDPPNTVIKVWNMNKTSEVPSLIHNQNFKFVLMDLLQQAKHTHIWGIKIQK
jgi:hypothetical protein